MDDVFKNTSESPIFKDKKSLDPEVTPRREELVCREKQIDYLVNHLNDLVQYDSAKNLMITGDTGVGKTATTRLVLDDLRDIIEDEGFHAIYMSDMQNQRNVLRNLSKKLDLGFFSFSELEEYYDRLQEKIIKENMTVAIVLDEVNKLFKNGHGNPVFKRLLEVRKEVNSADTDYLLIISIT